MADIGGQRLKKGAHFLRNYFRSEESRTVVYERGLESVELLVNPGRIQSRLDRRLGSKTTVEQRDYYATAADLVLGGNQTVPMNGDLIHEIDTNANTTRTYEVSPPLLPVQDSCFRYTDRDFLGIVIHTKLRGVIEQ